jgi:16S rRNA (guanine966-N2)-methyltransferase
MSGTAKAQPGVRIIAGDWRGRKLATPAGQDTRPTAARVREALFSMLVSRLGGLTGLHVADLYAGSGALGLEALSRGAAHCTFVERDRAALAALENNVATLSARDRARIIPGPVASAPGPLRPLDLLLVDPPYAETGIADLLERLASQGWFTSNALISIETGHDQSLDPVSFTVTIVRDIGKARLTLLRWNG